MLKKTKFVNIICIVLVLSVLALALAVGLFGINALRNDTPINMLDGFNDSYEKETLPPPPPPVNPENNLLPYRVRSDKSIDAIYLRAQSYGDYDGKEWLLATPYTQLIDDKYPATYLGSKVIEYRNFSTPIALEIVPNNMTTVVPSYTATALLGNPYNEEYDIPANDIDANAPSSEYYRMYYYDYKNTTNQFAGIDPAYEGYEAQYCEFVKEQYLEIDPDMKEYMLGLAEEQYFVTNALDLPSKVADYVKGLGVYSVHYDPNLDDEEDVVKAFIEKYQAGTCKHFATVGTLMFRALGIPARYVVGYLTETVSGEWVQLTNLDAHAWVEIYVDGFGWKTVEVTPQRESVDISIKPIDVNKYYDGTPLVPEQKIEGFEEYEEKGYTYEVVISGEITEPGITQSVIESIKFFDSKQRDVTHNFVCTYETGAMLVKVGTITLKSESFDFRYNGTIPKSNLDLCSVELPENGLWEGHTIEFVERELSTEIGMHPHAFAVLITNENGESVTGLYDYLNDFGSINVISNIIVIRAKSASKIYDGSPLIMNEIEVISGILAEGDEITDFEVVGEQITPGTSENVVELSSIVISNANGEDVTSNYQIVVEDGTLTVTRK